MCRWGRELMGGMQREMNGMIVKKSKKEAIIRKSNHIISLFYSPTTTAPRPINMLNPIATRGPAPTSPRSTLEPAAPDDAVLVPEAVDETLPVVLAPVTLAVVLVTTPDEPVTLPVWVADEAPEEVAVLPPETVASAA